MSNDWKQDGVDAWNDWTDPAEVEDQPDAELAELELHLMEGFLAGHGVDLETADPAQILEAAYSTEEWFNRAGHIAGIQRAQDDDAISVAEEIAAGRMLEDFMHSNNTNVEEAAPYIEGALEAFENGQAESPDAALQQAGEQLGMWQTAAGKAMREVAHRGHASLHDGMTAAFKDFRQRNDPAGLAAPAREKPVSTSNGAQGLGSVAASQDALHNAIGRMAASVRAEAHLRDVAREHAADS